MDERLRQALERFEVAVPDWHEGQKGIFVVPASLDDGFAVTAAARRFLALTETGRREKRHVEHVPSERAPYACSVHCTYTEVLVIPADYLTEED